MKKTSIFLILALFATNACQTSKEKETLSAETSASKIQQVKEIPAAWQDQMKLLDSSLTDIYPLILSPQDFQRKDNQEFILSRLEVISEISKKVNHSPMSQMSDPSLNFISFDFRDQAELAKNSFEAGNKDFARFELLKTTQFCIECHTQSNRGPSFQSAKATARFEKLNLLDQAEMLTATRKFDEALLKYKQFFGLKETSWDYQFRAESAVHNSLSILIRFKRDAKQTKEFLNLVKQSVFIPVYLKNIIQVWEEDVHTWSLAFSKNQKPSLAQIKVWMERVSSRTFDYGSLGGEIWSQLSISYLHEILDTIDQQNKTEIFWLLGSAYVNSMMHYQTSLGQKYLQSCIRSASHTPLAKKCYGKLEEYVFDMYSGSAGTFMPLNEEIQLKDLKKLAY